MGHTVGRWKAARFLTPDGFFIVYRKYVVRKEFQTEFAYATALISRIIVSVETIRAP